MDQIGAENAQPVVKVHCRADTGLRVSQQQTHVSLVTGVSLVSLCSLCLGMRGCGPEISAGIAVHLITRQREYNVVV